MGVITLPEPPFAEIGSGLHAHTRTPTIDKVAREDGIHGGDIELIRIACLDRVLNQGIQANHDVLEALDILDVLHEVSHRILALCEFYLTVLAPEVLASHASIGLFYFRTFTLEHFLGNLCKRVIAQTGGADDDGFLDELCKLQFGNHIILGKNPFSVFELFEFLLYAHILHEIHGSLFRQSQFTAAYMIGGVFQDVDITSETEIHLVVGQEMQVYTTIAVDLEGVLDVEAVEIDGILTNR